jgi:hypothetical protein
MKLQKQKQTPAEGYVRKKQSPTYLFGSSIGAVTKIDL